MMVGCDHEYVMVLVVIIEYAMVLKCTVWGFIRWDLAARSSHDKTSNGVGVLKLSI